MQPLLGKGAEGDRASQTPKLLPSKGYLCSLLRVHFEHPWSQACGGRSGKVPASLVGSSPDPPAHYPTKWAGERNDDIQWGHRHSGLGVLGHHGKTWPWIFWTPAFFFFFYCAHGMWTFPGQGLDLRHSSDPSCCSDTTRSLTHAPPGNSWTLAFCPSFAIHLQSTSLFPTPHPGLHFTPFKMEGWTRSSRPWPLSHCYRRV